MFKTSTMKYFAAILSFMFLVITNTRAQTNPDEIVGVYHTPKKDGKVAIYKKGSTYFGKLIWGIKNLIDKNNPDKTLRTRNMVGSDFMTGFTFKDGEYVNGKIYDPESGKTYNCKMWLDDSQLKVRGYWGVSLLGRTETFVRTN